MWRMGHHTGGGLGIIVMSPSKWTGKYKAIKAECKEHQISQSGDLKTCLNRLRTHYKEPHQTATRRARTLTMTDFWKPKGTPS